MVQALENSGRDNALLKLSGSKNNNAIQDSTPDRVPTRADSISMTMESSASVVYNSSMLMKGGSIDTNETLKDYVINLLQEQRLAVKFAIDSERVVDFNTMTPEEARELISENGYFGVKKTSDRIVGFAMEAAGNDPSKLEDIKAAVTKGFRDAEEACGGVLADISYDTLDAIMEKFSKWAQQLDGREGEITTG